MSNERTLGEDDSAIFQSQTTAGRVPTTLAAELADQLDPADGDKKVQIYVMVTQNERRTLKLYADKVGLPVSDLVAKFTAEGLKQLKSELEKKSARQSQANGAAR